MITYRILSILFSAVVLALSFAATAAVRKSPSAAQKLPRMRAVGLLLGAAVLTWCAGEGALMLPSSWAILAWVLLPVTIVSSWLFLDFPLARSIGGLLVLLANYAIQHCFAYYCAWRGFYTVIALAWGIAGLALIAWPWRLRDLLEWSSKHPRSHRWIWLFSGLCAAALAILPFIGSRGTA